jgi:peptide/nickel transport system substrate-binding protein
MPDSVKELFTYNPDKAKKLLAEAGYPNGFTFKVQVCSASPTTDLLPLVAAYLEKVGVKMEIQPMEYGAFLSAMTTKTNAPATSCSTAHQPDHLAAQELRQGPGLEPVAVDRTPSSTRRWPRPMPSATSACARSWCGDDPRVLDKAPYIWLPTPYRLHRPGGPG